MIIPTDNETALFSANLRERLKMADFVSQKNIFIRSEGDQWFSRNRHSYSSSHKDIVIETLRSIDIVPTNVLEIGCSNGKRLGMIRDLFNSNASGIDPSEKAVLEGKIKYPDIDFLVGTADSLPYPDNSFDMIIFGFCLYLCDRSDLFKIAYEADRCLRDQGTLVIVDFSPPFPFKNSYAHHEGVYSFKMDYPKMFSWNPCYAEVAKIVTGHSGFKLRDVPNEKIAVTFLRKNSMYAYLDEPF